MTAESDSSWTTRPLMGTLHNTEQQQQQQLHTTKEIKGKCVSPDTISHQQSETELNPSTNKFPDVNTSMLFANIFVPRTNQSNRASEPRLSRVPHPIG
jgi:hypothetical protein